MKHLLCEHQNTISELKADDSASTEVLHKRQEQLETEIHKEMRSIKEDIRSLDNESLVKELKLVCSTHQVYFNSALEDLRFDALSVI